MSDLLTSVLSRGYHIETLGENVRAVLQGFEQLTGESSV